MANFKHTEIKGVIPALITPFDENENFDEVRMRKIVNWLIDEKVDGFYLTGSTGEGFLMTPEERKKVVEVVVDERCAILRVDVAMNASQLSEHHLIPELAKVKQQEQDYDYAQSKHVLRRPLYTLRA